MIIKTNYSYVIKEESVTVWNHQAKMEQYISFNCFSLQSRKKFNKFKLEIANSLPEEYDNINDIYGLATRFDIRATGGHRPTFIDTIAF